MNTDSYFITIRVVCFYPNRKKGEFHEVCKDGSCRGIRTWIRSFSMHK